METIELLYLFLVAAGGGFIQRVSGFGLGIFVMLFLPHFMPTHTAAAAVSSLFSCGTSTYNVIKYRKRIDYKTVLPMLIASLVTIPFAVHFSASITQDFFKMLLGIVLIILSVYFLFFNKHVKIKPTIVNGAVSGALGGILGGLFSTGGPPVVLYLSHAVNETLVYFASIQFYFCLTNIYATATRALNGIITWNLLAYALLGMIGCMLGDFLGKRIFDKLNPKNMKLIIYIGMIISGILMII